jgi:hypothetical protein
VTTLASALTGPVSLAQNGDSVFVMTAPLPGQLGPPPGCAIQRIPLAGGSPALLTDDAVATSPVPMAADAAYVYWTYAGVWRAPVSGGVAAQWSATDWVDADELGIALDGGDLYWLQDGMGVLTIPISGAGDPAPATLYTSSTSSNLAQDAQDLYWMSDNAVVKAPKAGGTPAVLAAGPLLGGIAVDAENVYYTVSTAPALSEDAGVSGGPQGVTVKKLPKGGGTPSTLVSWSETYPPGSSQRPYITVEGSYLYYAEDSVSTGRLLRVPVSGGTPEPIADLAGGEHVVIACPGGVCWADSTPDGNQFSVQRFRDGP